MANPDRADLHSSLQTPMSAALILAAGLGSRLRPLTLERPKPLVEVLGTPLIFYALEKAYQAGVKQIAINTHHLGDALQAAVGDAFKGTPIRYAAETQLLGTGGGIRNLAETLGGIPMTFAVMNADALIDIDLQRMSRLHAQSGVSATLALKDTEDKARFGLIGTDSDERVRTFAGRTRYQGPVARERMFCGVHVLEPPILERLPLGEESCINQIGYPPLLDEGGDVLGFDAPGYFCDVGTPERLFGANMDLLGGRVLFRHFDPFERFTRHADAAGNPLYTGRDVQLPPDWRDRLKGPLLLDDGVVLEAGAQVGPFVIAGKNCRIGAGARLSQVVLQSGAEIEADSERSSAVIGRTCRMDINT